MIKINLLRTFSTSSSEVLQELDEQKQAQINFAKRVVILILGPAALYGFELYYIPQIQTEQVALTQQLSEISTFNQKKESLKIEIEKYEQDKKRLNLQTQILQRIQKERVLSVDLIHKVSEIIPQEVWLTNLKIEKDSIDIRGDAIAEKDVNEFNAKLFGVPFLKDSMVVFVDTGSDTKFGIPVKSFQIKVNFSQGTVQ